MTGTFTDPNEKYLLYQAYAGFNDILCCINRCVDWAKCWGRLLIVDTSHDYPNNSLHVPFSRIFKVLMDEPWIAWEVTDEIREFLETLPVYPDGWTYNKYNHPHENYDAAKMWNQRAALLVHCYTKGGKGSMQILPHLQLQPEPQERIRQQLSHLPREYDAVHIRATDFSCDYKPQMERISSNLPILVCSDNKWCLDYAAYLWGDQAVFTNSKALSCVSQSHGGIVNLHTQKLESEEKYFQRVCEMLADLQALSGARNLHLCKDIDNIIHGYSFLSKQLHADKELRKRFFNEE